MLFYIRHQNKDYRVRVESKDEKMHVVIDDGPEEAVDLIYSGNDCMFLHEDSVFHANVVGDKGEYTVWRPEGNLHFTVESEYKRLVGLLRGQDLDQETHVTSKMPGKIVKIIAKVGEVVEKGTSVIVMEAMKMENEIRTSSTGKIKKICVKEGQAVETGALLIELEVE
jgi:biotin carboxyl carrier protein